jgi:hypothetical protein
MEIRLHAFLTSALEFNTNGKLHATELYPRTPNTCQIRGWVSPTDGLDVVATIKILSPFLK